MVNFNLLKSMRLCVTICLLVFTCLSAFADCGTKSVPDKSLDGHITLFSFGLVAGIYVFFNCMKGGDREGKYLAMAAGCGVVALISIASIYIIENGWNKIIQWLESGNSICIIPFLFVIGGVYFLGKAFLSHNEE